MAIGCQADLSRGVIIVSGHGDNSGDPATAGVQDACWVHQPCIADSGLAGEFTCLICVTPSPQARALNMWSWQVPKLVLQLGAAKHNAILADVYAGGLQSPPLGTEVSLSCKAAKIAIALQPLQDHPLHNNRNMLTL